MPVSEGAVQKRSTWVWLVPSASRPVGAPGTVAAVADTLKTGERP